MVDYKYIMMQDRFGRKYPVIFPAHLVHSDIAKAIQRGERQSEVAARATEYACSQPVNAGFCTLAVASTHGESETLSLKSDPEDAQKINVHAYTGGIESGMEPMIERMLVVKLAEQLLDRVK
jgi:hypothetical protein